MSKQTTIFITGATGLIGSYLLKMLLANGDKVYALARSNDNKSARQRVTDTVDFWDKKITPKHANNLIVLEGDITQDDLGLGKRDKETLINNAEEIFHCAAVTQFNWTIDDIRKQNVTGTQNILELAVECQMNGNFRKVNHLSTAYICGDYKGVFREDDLDVGQGFQTTYVQSKFEAEKLVLEYRNKGLWIDIYRPPLVVGESATGKTFTFQQSVYQLFHIWNLGIFDHFPGKGLLVNIIFVDELCNAIFRIASLSSSENKNYHPFSSEAVPLELILDMSNKFLEFRKPELISRENFLKNNPTPAQKMLLQNNILLFNDYVRLDSKTTEKVLEQYGFEFSKMNKDYLLKVLEYCTEAGFLKKHHKKVFH